jgi:sugar phosphate isomerase/epimerase
MKSINRRKFIEKTAMGLGGAWAFAKLPELLYANREMFKDIPIGFQTFAVRDKLSNDFPGTLKIMADLGYKLTEMCFPKGYATAGFGLIAKMKTSDIRSMITDAGLSCPSCHFGFPEMTDKLDESIEFAHELGLRHMICSSFWLPKTATLNDYLGAADKLNQAAEKVKKAGMQAGFHNHDMEFEKLDGELIYDALLKRLDPALVKMQFQTEVINLGYKGSDYFTKYPGRFISSHLSDWTTDKKQVAVGKGVIDWKEFFATAKTGGVETFFVEMDFDKFKDSATYIKGLKG